MNDTIIEKLKILAESAKYDVSCASSGISRAHKSGGIGNTAGWGICHSFSEERPLYFIIKNNADQLLPI